MLPNDLVIFILTVACAKVQLNRWLKPRTNHTDLQEDFGHYCPDGNLSAYHTPKLNIFQSDIDSKAERLALKRD